jgi:hypothetical protein
MSADNCFPALANPALAQRLMDEQLETDWPAALTMLARSRQLHWQVDNQLQEQARRRSRQTLGPRQLGQDFSGALD